MDTQERIAFVKNLGIKFLNELSMHDLTLPKNIMATINDKCITIGMENKEKTYFEFKSEVEIEKIPLDFINPKKGFYYTINYGTTGSFSPNNKPAYTRTLIASELLLNWKTVKKMVSKYTDIYVTFVESLNDGK